MTFEDASLPGLILVTPRVFQDCRGFFYESYNEKTFAEAGVNVRFVQDNHSKSCAGTLRGLHFQAPPHAQDKLIRVTHGEVYDVVVDSRRNSPTCGQWEAVTLSAENRKMLLVPKGFAHGFCVLSDTAEVLYKCSDFYAPKTAGGICWDDPDIGIEWPV